MLQVIYMKIITVICVWVWVSPLFVHLVGCRTLYLVYTIKYTLCVCVYGNIYKYFKYFIVRVRLYYVNLIYFDPYILSMDLDLKLNEIKYFRNGSAFILKFSCWFSSSISVCCRFVALFHLRKWNHVT